MKIGIDLDNTIVDYSKIFSEIGQEVSCNKNLTNKELLSDHLRSTNQEKLWTKIQGEVYGPRMNEANIQQGFKEALISCVNHIDEVVIISHRTIYPVAGGKFNMHKVAHNWIRNNIILDQAISGIKITVIFETTISKKINSIKSQNINFFIDDHLGVLTHKLFPREVKRIHYSKKQIAQEPIITMKAWRELPLICKQYIK